MINAKNAFLDSLLKEGEKYGGLLLNKNGEPDEHIILLPGDNDAADWNTQMDWAASIGGKLPTRRMQALLVANLPEEFKPDWYWSGEQRESGSAWCQGFDDGYQGWSLTDCKCRARAVRSVAI
jgi:hypothetical protein